MGLVTSSPVRKIACGSVDWRMESASAMSSRLNQENVGPCGGSHWLRESTPDATRVSPTREEGIQPSRQCRATKTRKAPTATPPARYQNTSTLVLSHSQGWKTNTLAA